MSTTTPRTTRLTLLESHTELHHTRQGVHSTRGELAKSLRTSTTSIIALPALHSLTRLEPLPFLRHGNLVAHVVHVDQR
eukprot:904861-Alexandrium_andersonii.AAC.1